LSKQEDEIMKILYLDCSMGAAGDMLTAALLELLPDPDAFIRKMNSLGIPGVQVKREEAVKCGITGTHISVTVNGEEETEEMHEHHHHHHDHDDVHEHHHKEEHEHHHMEEHEHHHTEEHEHHHHSGMSEIEQVISGLDLPEKVKKDVLAVYGLIAEAESHVHGRPVSEIHFHEVGTMDAIADITAVCLLMNEINPDKVAASSVHVGSGHVKCAHGTLPVPAPATAFILKDVPIYGGSIESELCTPTGAALLKYFVSEFGSMPVMKPEAIGYGMGKKDFETVNCIRAIQGETADKKESIWELSCNVDDMTAEEAGFAMNRLFEGGALDVYTLPAGMKKSRPGMIFCVMCREEDRQKMVSLLFKYTTTIGVREQEMNRYVLNRTVTVRKTPWGDVRCKESAGYGVVRTKYEYEDLARIAEEQGMSLETVRKSLDF
jgi:hypothetical protein